MTFQEDPKKPNVLALEQFMFAGKPIPKGTVLAKNDFSSSGEWRNLCAMTPPRLEQTSDPVGPPKDAGETKDAKKSLPGM